MKTISKRFFVLLAVLALFVGCLATFLVKFAVEADAWVAFPGNGHLYSGGVLKNSGAIFDRTGRVLKYGSEDGGGYNDSEEIRRATLHVVGDKTGAIATGAQTIFGSKLSNYNIFTGVYGLDGSTNGTDATDLYLTVDAEIERAAYKALGNRKGAVAVYNYKTGELLCLVSTPTFDPENPPEISDDDPKWDGVYLNRATNGLFAPGSIFKIITSAAALEYIPDIEEREFTCTGSYEIGPDKVTCPNRHGTLDFKRAMSVSCNCTYAQIALELGGDKLQKVAERAGYNSSISYGPKSFATSSVDAANASGSLLAWAGIGQHTDLQNPAHMAVILGAIANGGRAKNPYLLERTERAGVSESGRSSGELDMFPSSVAEKLQEMLRYNVEHNYGSGRFAGLTVGAKSGTAEVGEGKENHAWFAGYVEEESCPIAFAVVVENGGAGSSVAGDVAGKVVTACKKALG